MLDDPAYPSRYSLDAEQRAVDRDIRDEERIVRVEALIATWLDELMPVLAGRLEHPAARWQPGDLLDALCEQLANARAERANLTGPLVIEECE
jgi:hypothetical protein